MKRKWLWPLLLSLLILAIIAGSGIYMTYKTNQAKNTIYVDDYIKHQTIEIKGRVAQHHAVYYLKPGNKQPVKLHVKEGETVSAGNPLFTYTESSMADDHTELSLQLDNKRVEKEQIEGQIAAYEERLRTADLEETPTIQAQINWLESEQTKAENNIGILEQKQKEMESKINEQTIKAGAAGIVLDIDDNQLQTFTANRQDKPIMTLSTGEQYFEGYADRTEVELLAPAMTFQTTDEEIKGGLTKVALTPSSVLSKKEKPEKSFLIEGKLNQLDGLYVGDDLTIEVHPSTKDRIWLPRKYVKEVEKNKKTQYVVQKIYGNDKKEEAITVERKAKAYYLVTKGLSAIDKLEAFEK